jgi:holliday junction DNA helicase RuvB
MATHRPDNFENIIGQQDIIRRLKISIFGCSQNNRPLSHVLLDGPPGLGKTTIAFAIANELGTELIVANAASIRSVSTMTKYLLNLTDRCVLFIDEIHRLPKLVEEFLYPAMEDFKATIILDSEPEQIDILPFTLIGATTSGGTLSQPFYDRFTIKEHLNFYTQDELAELARLNAGKSGLSLSEENALEIAKRSKGTPRILNARMEWYANYISYFKDSLQDINVDNIFKDQGIDSNGLDDNDRKYIDILKANTGNPLGIKNISSMTGLSIDTIENSIEPYLVRTGIVVRTQKGRALNLNRADI